MAKKPNLMNKTKAELVEMIELLEEEVADYEMADEGCDCDLEITELRRENTILQDEVDEKKSRT